MAEMMPLPDPDLKPETKPEWIRFEGTADVTLNKVVLRPFRDETIQLHFRRRDVQVTPSFVAIRKKAQALSISIPDESVIHHEVPGTFSPHCGAYGSMCIGRVEICCDNRKVVNSCAGFWPCPRKDMAGPLGRLTQALKATGATVGAIAKMLRIGAFAMRRRGPAAHRPSR